MSPSPRASATPSAEPGELVGPVAMEARAAGASAGATAEPPAWAALQTSRRWPVLEAPLAARPARTQTGVATPGSVGAVATPPHRAGRPRVHTAETAAGHPPWRPPGSSTPVTAAPRSPTRPAGALSAAAVLALRPTVGETAEPDVTSRPDRSRGTAAVAVTATRPAVAVGPALPCRSTATPTPLVDKGARPGVAASAAMGVLVLRVAPGAGEVRLRSPVQAVLLRHRARPVD
jgi:hypothetical protein